MLDEMFDHYRNEVVWLATWGDDAPVAPLSVDRYLAASLLQKAIRRSETEWALQAAQRLNDIDPSFLWRRLCITLFEDVGLLNEELAISVLASAPRRGYARASWPVVAYLVRRLCKAPKTQVANHLIHLAIWDGGETEAQSDFADLSWTGGLDWILDPNASAVQKARAAWMLSGLAPGKSHEPQLHPEADRERLLVELDGLLESPRLSFIARHGARTTQLPLPLAAVIERIERPRGLFIAEPDTFRPWHLIAALPSWAFDQHTRAGAEALRSFAEQKPEVVEWARKSLLNKAQAMRAVRSAFFEIESAPLSARVQIPAHQSLLRRVMSLGAYRTPENSNALYALFHAYWDVIQQYRADAVRAR